MNMATISSLMLLAVLCAGLSEVKAASSPTPSTTTMQGNPSPSGPGNPSPSGPGNPSPSGPGNPSPSGPGNPSPSGPGNPSPSGQDSSTSTTVPTTFLSVEDKIAGWIPDLTCADKSCKQEYEAVKNVTKFKKDFCDAYDDYKKCFDDNSKTCSIETDTLDDVNKFCSGCSLQASVVLFLVAIFASLM